MEYTGIISAIQLRYRPQITLLGDGVFEIRAYKGGDDVAATACGNVILDGGKISGEEFRQLFSLLCQGAPLRLRAGAETRLPNPRRLPNRRMRNGDDGKRRNNLRKGYKLSSTSASPGKYATLPTLF